MSALRTLLACSLFASAAGCRQPPKVIDEPAPALTLTDTAGGEVLVPEVGRDVLLYFFASW
ncbi:MAG: hypothetical protein HYZ28_10960 [Myxococcales bacterium]|nr:hypothetical protein [Myxococcales bacterium]